jgi:hypothetical protein
MTIIKLGSGGARQQVTSLRIGYILPGKNIDIDAAHCAVTVEIILK